MTNAEWGAIMLVVFGVLYFLNKMPATRAILAFVGTILVGTDGHLTHWLSTVAVWLAGESSTLTAWLVGIPVAGILTVITGIVFVHDLMPKHSAGKRTGWAGILLAALIVAGATGFSALDNVPTAVNNGVTSVQQSG
jgi:hypothetical protein